MPLIALSCSLLVVLGLAGAIEIGLRCLQLFLAFGRGTDSVACPAPAPEPIQPFISVHVPTCNEPAPLVIATLRSLARSTFARFEVIVLDNNTVDHALWAPVAAEVERLGSRFRFIRHERLAGAKAGALNVALVEADTRTTHVAIVDADYQVRPEFLGDALAAARREGVDYVQFPQAYRAVGQAARGMECELGDYFACLAAGAGRPGSMLPTGTLSLFTVDALRTVGGWPMRTITEDAEIGVRLQAAGYRGLWLARSGGQGLLPVDLRGIRKQRARWSAGNFQVLMGLNAMMGRRPAARDLVYLVGQLTAWISLVLPAAIVLLLLPLMPGLPLRDGIASLAGATILTSAALSACRLILASDHAGGIEARLEAVVTKLALTWTSATAWIAALSPRPLKFHRTPKAIEAAAPRDVIVLGVSLAFLAMAIVYAGRLQLGPALACMLLATVWSCGQFVDKSLRLAAAHNTEPG